MTGNAYDTKKDFEQCAASREWRLTHAGALPRQRSDNAAESALAKWCSKALPRRQRALRDRPSERQLTPDEAVHLNSIVGMAMGEASANAPASESIDTQLKRRRLWATGHTSVAQQSLCQMWLPSVSAKRHHQVPAAKPLHCVCVVSAGSLAIIC